QFEEQGYIVLPNFLDEDHQQRLRNDVDAMTDERENVEWHKQTPLVSYKELGLLTSHPKTISALQQLMGESIAMHHIHGYRQDAGAPGVHWHHDYEQVPQSNRKHIMVHVFYYLNGLNGEVGDLLAVPGSHKKICNRDTFSSFGDNDLPGSKCFDNLPNGSAIIVHSAMFHARRAKPGGEGYSRYFIDISYCQAGVQWPAYGHMKPINELARNNHCSRDGAYSFLYDDSFFFDHHAMADEFHENNIGSLALKLKTEEDSCTY
ncbi:MAG: phytanoyl-CoA dioxygenase family protein, partial [Planctomycetes bacterium]|nr:phytanoyl-CoA dioxygenase family protein [Planctomycetota bacterium]